MLRPVVTLAGVAFVGVLLTKLLWLALLPLFAMFVGFVAFAIKATLIIGLLYLGYKLATKLMERPAES